MIIVDVVLSIVSYLLTVLTLGLAIGFSPLIYGTFAATFTQKQPHRQKLQLALIAGVFVGTLVLLTSGAALGMLYYHATTSGIYRAIIGIVGVALVAKAAHCWLATPSDTATKKSSKSMAKPAAIFVIGFTKTIFSAMSIAAALVASTLFATVGSQPIVIAIIVAAICIGAIGPFLFIMWSKQAAGQVKSWTDKTQTMISSLRTSKGQIIPTALACCGLALIAYALSH